MGATRARLVTLAVVLLARGAANAAAPPRFYASLPPPKVLLIGQGPAGETRAEHWRATTPASVTYLQLFYNDQSFHHLCDKPLEQTKEQQAALFAAGDAYRKSVLARLADFDVIVTDLPAHGRVPESDAILAEVHARVRERVSQGGRLIVLGEPLGDPAMAGVMPCRATAGSVWTNGSDGATDHPLVRGLPFEVTGAHVYGPLCEAIDGTSVPLTRATDQNRLWWRALPGGGQSVYVPDLGGRLSDWELDTAARRHDGRPDDGLVWDAFVTRAFYWLTHGDRAFPVLAKIALPAGSRAEAGQDLAVPIEVENRSDGPQPVVLSLSAFQRRSPQVAAATQSLTLAKGERRTVVLRVRADFPSTDDLLSLRAGIAGRQGPIADSFTFIPFQHAVPVAVEVPRTSYGPGEVIAVRVRGDAAESSDARVDLYLVDHRGRVVARADARGNLVMPDGGPEWLSSYWVTAVVTRHQAIAGTARVQVQLDRPWDMRAQLQLSVWTDGRPLRKMSLLQDAGFNALGYPGNSATADRLGLHQYVEGSGINTFGVAIDHASWPEVRADMEAQLQLVFKRYGGDSRTKSLVSLGEESGFGNGWGTRYYWTEDQAPSIPRQVFDAYLAERYRGDVRALNREWAAHYAGFGDVPLERRHARVAGGSDVDPAAGTEAQHASGPEPRYLATTAPDYETYTFFDWYYERYTQLAMATYRERRNPVPLSILSASSGFHPRVDVFNFGGLGPFYPKETALVKNAVARRDDGDTPGFALLWAFFDLEPLWRSVVLSHLLVGNTHLSAWVDVPLTFNPDLTHTRASFWTKLLTRQLHPIEPVLLHRRFAPTPGLAMLVTPQPLPKGLHHEHFGSAIDPNAPVYSALEESGYLPKVVGPDQLAGVSALVASYAQVVGAGDAKQIIRFVKQGGLLISTPWLASCSPHGNALATYPAPETGLAELLGFKLRNTSQGARREEVTVGGLTLVSKGRDRVTELAAGVHVAARYADGTPLMLERQVGRGRVVYLNLMYDWDGWWNSFYEPGREAYRRLIDSILVRWGRTPADYFIGFESARVSDSNRGWWGTIFKAPPHAADAVPWWASQLFSDPSGRTKYLTVFADHRSPHITAQVRWRDPGVTIVDLMTGASVPIRDGHATLTLEPGGAAIWAISARAPAALAVSGPDRVVAGQPIKLAIASPDASGAVVDAYGPSGRAFAPYSRSNVTLANGRAAVEIPTAANDAPGLYRLVVTESITRRQATQLFTLQAGPGVPARDALAPFPDRPSDRWPAATMSSSELLRQLRLLRSIYLGTFSGMDAKYMLSYFLDVPFRPDNRHAILRRLQRVAWTPHLGAVADALRAGETFYLTGEDLNVDPQTGVTIDPFAQADAEGFLSALAHLPGARRASRTVDGLQVETITLGKGSIVICRQASADRSAYLSPDFAAWQARIKKVLTAPPN